MFAALAKVRSIVFKSLTHKMSRSSCITDKEPPCAPKPQPKEVTCTPKLSKEACVPPPVEKSMWENGCCEMPCPDALPRFDTIYYKRSDKARRRYTQTWVECPTPVKKSKANCCYDETKLPPIEKRPRNHRPQTACNMMPKDCGLEKNLKCIKIVLPGCRSRRNSFHCLIEQNPRKPCAKRECAPYPSFSECAREKASGLRKKECGCVFVPARCELFKEFERWIWLKQNQSSYGQN